MPTNQSAILYGKKGPQNICFQCNVLEMGASIAVTNFNDRYRGISKVFKNSSFETNHFTNMFYVKKYEFHIKNKLKNKWENCNTAEMIILCLND